MYVCLYNIPPSGSVQSAGKAGGGWDQQHPLTSHNTHISPCDASVCLFFFLHMTSKKYMLYIYISSIIYTYIHCIYYTTASMCICVVLCDDENKKNVHTTKNCVTRVGCLYKHTDMNSVFLSVCSMRACLYTTRFSLVYFVHGISFLNMIKIPCHESWPFFRVKTGPFFV